jgi:exodeoxyribonuclease VII large subunit
MGQTLQVLRTHLGHLRKILGTPGKAVESYFFRIDELSNRLHRMASWILERGREKSLHLSRALALQSPKERICRQRVMILEASRRLEQALDHTIGIQRERFNGVMGRLASLSPLAILQRGYSITRKIPNLEVVRDADQVTPGDRVEVRIHRGALLCEVREARPPAKESY